MKIGIIILCRYNSKRFPGKILTKIHQESVLSHIVNRLKHISKEAKLIVATSYENLDNYIIEECEKLNVEVFRGALKNVAKRFMDCMSYYNLDYGVRINGDNFFVDPKLILKMMEIPHFENYDLITNVPSRSFPYGMSIEIVKSNTYAIMYSNIMQTGEEEHVTSWFYKNKNKIKMFEYLNIEYKHASGLNLALDTESDKDYIEKIYDNLENKTEFTLSHIVKASKKLNVEL